MNRFLEDIIRDEASGFFAGALKIILWPLSLVYGGAVRILRAGYNFGWFSQKKLPRPVISIGNITVGGSGKTPLVIWLVKRLTRQGVKVAVLTRGYKGGAAGNDEVRMIREALPDVPVIVGADRCAAAMEFLKTSNVDGFVMDDGFAHRRLCRDLDIVAVECLRGFGNGHLLPRGILREGLSGLKRADIIVVTKLDLNPDGEQSILETLKHAAIEKPVIRSRQRAAGLANLRDKTSQDPSWLNGRNVMVLSSIADPKALEETLKNLGACIAGRLDYPDHHAYSARDLRRISGLCRDKFSPVIVTTAKDAVKLEPLLPQVPVELDIRILNIELIIHDEDILFQRIRGLFRG